MNIFKIESRTSTKAVTQLHWCMIQSHTLSLAITKISRPDIELIYSTKASKVKIHNVSPRCYSSRQPAFEVTGIKTVSANYSTFMC